MPRKNDDSRQMLIHFPRPCEEKIDKLQSEIAGLKQAVGSIHADLKILTVAVKSLQLAVDQLPKDNH